MTGIDYKTSDYDSVGGFQIIFLTNLEHILFDYLQTEVQIITTKYK